VLYSFVSAAYPVYINGTFFIKSAQKIPAAPSGLKRSFAR